MRRQHAKSSVDLGSTGKEDTKESREKRNSYKEDKRAWRRIEDGE
jgi:hypothetical protein